MAGAFSDEARVAIARNFLFGTATPFSHPIYLALFTTDPGDNADYSGEPTAAEYARQLITFTDPAPAINPWVSSATVTFPVAESAWGVLTHAAIVDGTGPSASMLLHGQLGAAVSIPPGYQVKVLPGAAVVSFP